MKISRKQAEQLIETSSVLSTRVEQSGAEIRVSIELADSKRFIVTYDRKSHEKSYVMDDPRRS
jgi:hypothetical protein